MVGHIVAELIRHRRTRQAELAKSPADSPAREPRGRTGWPLAAVLITLLVMAPITFVVYKLAGAAESVAQAPGKLATEVAGAFGKAVRPKVSIKNVVLTAVASMQHQAKLVVLDTTIDLDVTKDESYTALGCVYLGTNRVRVIARENRIQYVIDLAHASAGDFAYDEPGKRLTIYVQRPSLDEDMVSVQSDPAKCYPAEYEGGWMRFDKSETLAHVREMLRPAVVQQGRCDFVLHEAERAGIAAVKTFADPLVGSLKGEGIAVDVQYR